MKVGQKSSRFLKCVIFSKIGGEIQNMQCSPLEFSRGHRDFLSKTCLGDLKIVPIALETALMIRQHHFWVVQTTSSYSNSSWAPRYNYFKICQHFPEFPRSSQFSSSFLHLLLHNSTLQIIIAKIETVVSQSSGGVGITTGCLYYPEMVFPND